MKITELIKSLEDKKKELGDVEVVIETSYPDSNDTYLSYNIEICKEQSIVAYFNDYNNGRKIFNTCLLLF